MNILNSIIYWSIVITPFSVAIAPGMANTFIGFFCAFYVIKKLIKRQSLHLNRQVLLFFSVIALISLLSFINSVSYSASFQGLVKLLKYFLIFAACSEEIRDRRHIQLIVISICCATVLMSIDGIWQLMRGYDFVHGIQLQSAIGIPRPTASFPNPNIFGVYMSALIPLIAGLALFYFKGIKKYLMIIVTAVVLAGVYLTLSRGSGLGIYLGLLFLCIAKRQKILTGILVAILLIFPFVMPNNIKQWAKEVHYNPLVFMCNQDRISIYANTINMIKQHPFIGVGVNTFSRNYGKYKTESAEKYMHTQDTIYAHNIYLQMAGETGLLGLGAFLLFIFVIFKLGFATWRRLKDEYLKTACISLLACLLSFLINGLTETSLYYPRVVMIFWFLIGMSLSLAKFRDAPEN